MKKIVFTLALGALVLGTYACSNANGAEAAAEETALNFDQDAKEMADRTCKIFAMMMDGSAANEDGSPTAEFNKVTEDATKFQEEMEKKYKKDSEDWVKFEKVTQELVDKCGK